MEDIKQQVNSIRGVSRKKILQKKPVVVFFLLLLIILFFISYKFIFEKKVYSNISVIWQQNIQYDKNHKNDIHYEKFKNGVFRYTNDGISYYNKDDLVYTVSHNIKEMLIVKNENYFLVSEINGTNVYIYDEYGLYKRQNIVGSIKKVLISNDNRIFICSLQNENYVMNEYDINLKLSREIFSSNYMTYGIPLDIDIDKNGKKMAVGYAYKSLEVFSSRAIIYDIDKNKDVLTNKILNEEFKGKYIARVKFFDENNILAVTDDGLYFIEINENIYVERIELKNKICSIDYNEKYFVILIKSNKDENEEHLYKILIYNSEGKKVSEYSIDFEYSFFKLVDDYIFIINDDKLIINDVKGNIRLKKEYDGDIVYIDSIEGKFKKRLIFGEIDCIKLVELK